MLEVLKGAPTPLCLNGGITCRISKFADDTKITNIASTAVVPNSGPVDPLRVHEGLAGGPRMASTSKKRKWNETYQQYGFTKFSRDGLDAAQCIHCSTVLANCSLKLF
ncbi:hypothetical protein GWK47_010994 [Chionoecetes opilio]|uniref:Uncharacterized protein n=1 Tax=Chionoecetes opilio TaxID=41210 RepID=A0A8J4XY69_CHIOP|nr:hypothetical protein GWK47_010994 [Chionoecetes opilio]